MHIEYKTEKSEVYLELMEPFSLY